MRKVSFGLLLVPLVLFTVGSGGALAQSVGSCGALLDITGNLDNTAAATGDFLASGYASGSYPVCGPGGSVFVASNVGVTFSVGPPVAGFGPILLLYSIGAPVPPTNLTALIGAVPSCGGGPAMLGVIGLNPIADGFGIFMAPNPFAVVGPGAPFSVNFVVPPGIPAGAFINLQGMVLSGGLRVTNGAKFTVGPPPTGSPTVTTYPQGDDTFVNHVFGCNSFDFYGTTYTDFWINSNGNITFGSGSVDYSETDAEFLGLLPRVALYWDDRYFQPTSSCVVTEQPGMIRVEYLNVAWYCAQSTYSTEKVEFFSGPPAVIKMTYISGQGPFCSALGGTLPMGPIVGISPGFGISGAVTPIDLTGAAPFVGGANNAIWENFNTIGNGFDIPVSVTFTALDPPLNTNWGMTVP